jgi:hypothetical protein
VNVPDLGQYRKGAPDTGSPKEPTDDALLEADENQQTRDIGVLRQGEALKTTLVIEDEMTGEVVNLPLLLTLVRAEVESPVKGSRAGILLAGVIAGRPISVPSPAAMLGLTPR